MNMKELVSPALFLILPVWLFGASSGTAAEKSSETSGQSTAKTHLVAATAEARKWQSDAVLVTIETKTAKPDGSAYTWAYLYDSPKAGDQVLIMIDEEGEVTRFPGITVFKKNIGDFIDSDQAMVAAIAAGLKTNDFGMTMSLKKADRAEWFIPGSDLSYTIDAVSGKLLSKE